MKTPKPTNLCVLKNRFNPKKLTVMGLLKTLVFNPGFNYTMLNIIYSI